MYKTFNLTLLSKEDLAQVAQQVAAQQVAMRKAEPRMRLLNMHYAPAGYMCLTAPAITGNWDIVPQFKKQVDKLRGKLMRS